MRDRNRSVKAGCTFLLVAFFCFSCSDDPESLSSYQQNVIDYFKNVTLGFEIGNALPVTRKWGSTMKIFVGGDKHNTTLLTYLDETIDGINSLATDGFSIEITTDSAASNAYLFLGSKEQFISLFPDSESSLEGNLGLFYVWWNSDNIIYRARIFIDTEGATPNRYKSLILEEVTQSLGLGRDSDWYPDSIFYETSSDGGFVSTYSDMDKDLIRLLYHPMMHAGLGADAAGKVIRKIFEQENN